MRRLAVMAILGSGLAACGGGGGGSSHPATCSPSGTSLQIAAQNVQFDTDCLAAPAGQAFTIAFDNKDAGTPHNVHVLGANSATLFKGDIITGVKSVTYDVPALNSGTYTFQCDVHTSMNGTFIVK